MNHEAHLFAILTDDAARMAALSHLRSLALSDGWIGAGFVRDAVWDRMHGRDPVGLAGDIDVIWYDPEQSQREIDRNLEMQLSTLCPDLKWSVKNQARMNMRNGDAAYSGVDDAMRHWPETATAVAVRLSKQGRLEINAPYGLDDLFALRLTPTPYFMGAKRPVFQKRVTEKRWLERYPLLHLL